MRTVEYLDAIRRRYKLTSDYQAHKLLGVTKQSITHYRNGKTQFADEVAARVAMLLNLDPLQVLADMHAERAQTDAQRAIWRMIAARVGQAALLLLAVILTAPLAPAEARQVRELGANPDSGRVIHSAQWRRRRRWAKMGKLGRLAGRRGFHFRPRRSRSIIAAADDTAGTRATP